MYWLRMDDLLSLLAHYKWHPKGEGPVNRGAACDSGVFGIGAD